MPRPLLIFSQSDYLFQVVANRYKFTYLMTNSADPDQLASLLKKPTDLDLHCLQRQDYPGSAGLGLKLEIHM